MESETLSALQDIRIALYILTAAVITGVVVNIIRGYFQVKNSLRRELDKLFSEESEHLFGNGSYDKLIAYCEEKLKEKPNDSYALWYLAKAHYQKNQFRVAKQFFEKLAKTEPSWEEIYVRPYLAKINETNTTASPTSRSTGRPKRRRAG